jgi:hypothetical protein
MGRTRAHRHAHACAYTCTRMRIHMHTHAHAHLHPPTHLHTHTHMQGFIAALQLAMLCVFYANCWAVSGRAYCGPCLCFYYSLFYHFRKVWLLLKKRNKTPVVCLSPAWLDHMIKCSCVAVFMVFSQPFLYAPLAPRGHAMPCVGAGCISYRLVL